MQPSETIVLSVNLSGLTSSSTVLSTAISYQTVVATTVISGPAGKGVPTGGTTGQVLSKVSSSDYDTTWTSPYSGNVTSVNGQTGVVNLTKSDIGLGNADNTSDANKPVSTATQTALNGKVSGPASSTDNAVPRFDGTTGKLIKDSQVTVDDNGVLTGQSLKANNYIFAASAGIGDITSSSQLQSVNQAGNTAVKISTQFIGVGADVSSVANIRYGNNANGAANVFAKSRGGSIGTNVIVQSGDVLGNFGFDGANGGSVFIEAARIRGVVDGTPSSTAMPGRLEFLTTPAGGNTATIGLTLDSANNLYPAGGKIGPTSFQQHTLPAVTSDTFMLVNASQSPTNKTFDNTNIYTTRTDRLTLQDPTDTTKQGVFGVSGLTTATTRTYQLPDASGTVALLTNTATFTNKTLTSPTINTPIITYPSATLTATTNTLATTDRTRINYINAASNAVSVTLPSTTTIMDFKFVRIDNSANAVTINVSGGTINGQSSISLPNQGDSVTVATSPTGGVCYAIGTGLSIPGLITAGTNVTITGAGTIASPYVINSTASGGGGGYARSINTVGPATTMGNAANTDYVYHFTSGGQVHTLPSASGNSNAYNIMNASAGNISINAASGESINGSSSIALIPNQSVTLYGNLTNAWGIC